MTVAHKDTHALLFVPHAPTQNFDTFFEKPSILTPIQRLYHALLTGALDEYLNPKTSTKREIQRRNAEWWIRNKDDGIFSFNIACESLGIDPVAARARILGGKVEARRKLMTD